LQKQKDLTKADSSAQQDQSRLTVDGLERMGRELIRLCDGIERHGLVDYEYGVWEDRIVEGEHLILVHSALNMCALANPLTTNSTRRLPRSD